MSLAEFSGSMQQRAAATAKIRPALEQLLADSRKSFSDTNNKLRKLASIFEKDAKAFRTEGSKEGNTRLVVTPESLTVILEELSKKKLIASSGKSGDDLLKAYIEFLGTKGAKVEDFEFYNDKGNVSKLTKFDSVQGYYDNLKGSAKYEPGTVPRVFNRTTAVRGLKFTHDNTATHMVEFLNHLGASITVKEFTSIFERGHVYAQATGRLLTVEDLDLESTAIGQLVKLNVLLDEASSHLNTPIHTELLASIKKDFKGTKLYMNIEFQLKRSDSGTGNRDAGDISGMLQMVSNYRKLMTEGIRRPDGSFQQYPKLASDTEIQKILSRFADKIEDNFSKLQKVLNSHIANAEDPNFLTNLKSSITLKQYIGNNIANIIGKGKHLPDVDIQHPKVSIAKVSQSYSNTAAELKRVTASIKQGAQKAKQEIAAKKTTLNKLKTAKVPELKTLQNRNYSLTSLQMLINASLQHVIAANMGNGAEKKILNYRTGRFAGSAQVTQMSQSREGMITAFYSYMKNPYQTFEPGFAQGGIATRDPKLLISKSIREIAATKVGNRLRAVSV